MNKLFIYLLLSIMLSSLVFAGEHLNLQVMDKNTPVTDVNIYKVNLNIVKVSG